MVETRGFRSSTRGENKRNDAYDMEQKHVPKDKEEVEVQETPSSPRRKYAKYGSVLQPHPSRIWQSWCHFYAKDSRPAKKYAYVFLDCCTTKFELN